MTILIIIAVWTVVAFILAPFVGMFIKNGARP